MLQTGPDPCSRNGFSSSQSASKGQWERRLQADIKTAKQALQDALTLDGTSSPVPDSKGLFSLAETGGQASNNSNTYASSTENIARLLKDWARNSSNSKSKKQSKSSSTQHSFNYPANEYSTSSSVESKNGIELSEAFESLFGFESFDSSNSEFSQSTSPEASLFQGESKPEITQVPLAMLENWLFDESSIQGKDLTNFSFDHDEDLF